MAIRRALNTMPRLFPACAAGALLLLVSATGLATRAVAADGDELSIDAAGDIAITLSPDGRRLAFSLHDRLWVMDAGGGAALAVSGAQERMRRPRFSPDGRRLAAEALHHGAWQIAVVDSVARGRPPRLLTLGSADNHAPVWSADGRTVIFSSRRGGDFDLWSVHTSTLNLARLTHGPADDLDPALHPDGETLTWVQREAGQTRIVSGRPGEQPRVLLEGSDDLRAPAWRPDATVLAYVRQSMGQSRLNMYIAGRPPLNKRMTRGEDVLPYPLHWLDRDQVVYAADGQIRRRGFGAMDYRQVPLVVTTEVPRYEPRPRSLPAAEPPDTRYLLRVGRMFDGIHAGYREQVEILVDGDRISAVRPWGETPPGYQEINLPGGVALPGLIDIATGPAGFDAADSWLAHGVTTVLRFGAAPGDAARGPRVLLGRTWCPRFDRDIEAFLARARDPRLVALAICDRADGEALAAGIAGARAAGLVSLVTRTAPGVLLGADGVLHGAFDADPGTALGQYADEAGILAASRVIAAPLLAASHPGGEPVAETGRPWQWSLLPAAARARYQGFGSATRGAANQARLRAALAGLAAVAGAGGRVLAIGGSPATPPGAGLREEMTLFVAAGLQPFQAWQMASTDTARALGLDAALGALEPGQAADIVVTGGDPLAGDFRAPRLTMAAGRLRRWEREFPAFSD